MNADSVDLDKRYGLLKSIDYQTGQDAEDAIENDKQNLAKLERKGEINRTNLIVS